MDPSDWGYRKDHFLSVFICVHLWLDVRQVLRSKPTMEGTWLRATSSTRKESADLPANPFAVKQPDVTRFIAKSFLTDVSLPVAARGDIGAIEAEGIGHALLGAAVDAIRRTGLPFRSTQKSDTGSIRANPCP